MTETPVTEPLLASATRLHDLDRASLASFIAQRCGVPDDRATRAAGRALRHAFVTGTRRWDGQSLSHGGLGRWAHAALLELPPTASLRIKERANSVDGTVRLLLEGDDGALIESVIIPTQKGRSRARATLCVSSQAGCARACTFCETGALGLRRQLHASEIIDQLRIAKKICADPAAPRDCRTREMVPTTISNIVFMGMGEPFDNLATVTRAINLVCDEHGFRWSASRITVSTVGVADRFAQFFSSTRAELAVSLNAPDDARRNRIMPINERFCMATLKTALLASLPPKRRVLFQYALFRDFNDSVEDADRLADYVTPIPCRINVIPANPGPDPTLQAPTQTAVDAFVHRLHRRGILTLVREPRGRDIGGACGQLAGSRRTAFVPLAAPRSRVR